LKKSINKLFPLSSKYDNKWIKLNSLGENVLYNLESLSGILKFNYGERVLDLGCGKAVSSIFMAKEFNVKVWAVDLTMDVTENMKRIKQQNCEDMVFPMQLNSRELPFPDEYFDVIICVD
jgi:cyclopropane fatty-acyl-phospholipid synthase-like methyltransferase